MLPPKKTFQGSKEINNYFAWQPIIRVKAGLVKISCNASDLLKAISFDGSAKGK